MAMHIVAWNFKDEVPEEKKAELKRAMKENLEGLAGKVPGLRKAMFIDEPASGSNREMALITQHDRLDDIEVYAKDPQHNAVADKYVRPYTKDRVSLNFSIFGTFLN